MRATHSHLNSNRLCEQCLASMAIEEIPEIFRLFVECMRIIAQTIGGFFFCIHMVLNGFFPNVLKPKNALEQELDSIQRDRKDLEWRMLRKNRDYDPRDKLKDELDLRDLKEKEMRVEAILRNFRAQEKAATFTGGNSDASMAT